MTIHGIYIKTSVRGKWHLYSTTESQETAVKAVPVALKAAKDQGRKIYRVAMKIFPTNFYIPEILNNVEHTLPEFN